MAHYHHHNNQTSGGFSLVILGAVIAAPLLFYLGFFQTATAPTIAAAAIAVNGALSIATLGIGALIFYASIGTAYLYSAAKECYATDSGVLDLLKSRIVNEDGWGFKGVVNSLGAVLWSPFLLIGGLAGISIKAIVKKSQDSEDEKIHLCKAARHSYSMAPPQLGSKTQPQTNDLPPKGTNQRLFTDKRVENAVPASDHVILHCVQDDGPGLRS
jgi:hypothetical protein